MLTGCKAHVTTNPTGTEHNEVGGCVREGQRSNLISERFQTNPSPKPGRIGQMHPLQCFSMIQGDEDTLLFTQIGQGARALLH